MMLCKMCNGETEDYICRDCEVKELQRQKYELIALCKELMGGQCYAKGNVCGLHGLTRPCWQERLAQITGDDVK